jgi:hypothetical protein
VAVVVIVMVRAMMMDILTIYNRRSCGGFESVKIKKNDLFFHLAAIGESGPNRQRCRCCRPRQSDVG